ncbi:MAG: hypothetical protein IPP40_18445 [bacterium]|nr:hypothetical protein [bacterium]
MILAMSADEVVKMLPTILRTAHPGAVVTDTSGAKEENFEDRAWWKTPARFLLVGIRWREANGKGLRTLIRNCLRAPIGF